MCYYVQEMNTAFLSGLANPFLSAFHRIAGALPGMAAAFLLGLVGMVTARALRTLAEAVLARARLDEHASRVGVNELCARLGLGRSPAYGIAFLIYWFVLFIFIVSAANAVDMTAVSEMLERFLLFMPRLLAALLILFGGLLFGRFLSEVVGSAASANNIPGGTALARAVYGGVLVFAAVTAMEPLGLNTAHVAAAIQIVLASAGLGLAIAFGLGGKDVAGEIIRDALKRPPEPR